MSVFDDFDLILDYAHMWNWAPDWYLAQSIYKKFPESYSILTPFAYSYLEEMIRTTTSDYEVANCFNPLFPVSGWIDNGDGNVISYNGLDAAKGVVRQVTTILSCIPSTVLYVRLCFFCISRTVRVSDKVNIFIDFFFETINPAFLSL